MTLQELISMPSYEIKIGSGAPQTDKEGKVTHFSTCNIQIFDMERKVTLKAVSGILGTGSSQSEAEQDALTKACELLGDA